MRLLVELVLSLKCIFQFFFIFFMTLLTISQHAIMQIDPLRFFCKIYIRCLLLIRECLVLVNNN